MYVVINEVVPLKKCTRVYGPFRSAELARYWAINNLSTFVIRSLYAV